LSLIKPQKGHFMATELVKFIVAGRFVGSAICEPKGIG
jgi:hypothetical protein